MTKDTAIREQARAVFLAALMVLSVMVGTVAFAGTAAASASEVNLSDNLAQGDEEVYINGSVDENGTVYAFIDSNGDGYYNDSETQIGSEVIDDYTDDGQYSITFATPSESGTYNVSVVQKQDDSETSDTDESTLFDGDSEDVSTTIDVDADAPVFGDESPEDGLTVNNADADQIVVPIEDANNSVDHITVTVRNSDGDINTWEIDPASGDSDGVSWEGGELTVDPGTGNVPALTDGSYDVSVSAVDTVGNENSTEFTFDVSSSAPTFSDNELDDTLTNDENETIEIGIDGNSYNLVNSSAELVIENSQGDSVSYDYEDDVYTNGTTTSTFSVDPSADENISAYPDGTYTVTVSAENELGNSAEETYTFTVDTDSPSVENVELTDAALNSSDVTENDEQVVVTFDEAVDASGVSANVNVDGNSEPLTFTHVVDEDGDTVETKVKADLLGPDLYSSVENDSAVVNVTSAQDLAGNSLANADSEDSQASFEIDTDGPSVTLGTVPNDDTLSGYVNVTSLIASQSDVDDLTVEVEAGQDSDAAVDITDTADNFDTTVAPDGDHSLLVTVEDDAGNVDTASADVTFNNGQTLTVDQAYLHGTAIPASVDDISGEEVSIDTDVFDYPTSAADDVVYRIDDEVVTGENLTLVAEEHRGETHVVEAELNGETRAVLLDFGPVEGAESVEGDTVDIGIVSDEKLDTLNATLATSDEYVDQTQVNLTVDDFDKTMRADGSYVYTTKIDDLRDGEYEVSITDSDATANTGFGDGTSSATVDDEAPSLIDADVNGVEKGQSQVTVAFSEPVENVALDDFSFEGDRASVIGGVDKTAGDGVYTLTFDSEIQTGDDPALEIDAETYSDTAGTSNEDDSVTVDSIELELTEGANLVSVPVEAGSVSLDSLDLSDVNAIWVYDEGEWKSYDPDAKENKFDKLEAGQGYVVYADSDTSIDARGFTKPAPSNDEIPDGPAVENLNVGWNLVGHFQEGQQSTDRALTTVDYVPEVGVLSQSSQNAFVNATTMEPGEAYWVFVEDSDLYTAVNYEDEEESAAPSVSDVEVTHHESNDEITSGDTVSVSATVEDDNLAGVYVSVSGLSTAGDNGVVELTQVDDTSTYDATFTADDIAEYGEIDLTVTAVDETGIPTEGNDTVSVVDTTVDSASINSPTNGDSTTLNTDESLTVNYDAEDINFENAYVVLNDGSDAANVSASAGTGSTVNVDLSTEGEDVGAGTYNVVLKVFDSAGNSNTVTESAVVTVDDGTIDSASIDSPSEGDVTNTDSIEFSASDTNLDTATLTIEDDEGNIEADGVDVTSEGGTYDISDLEDDSYKATLEVSDTAGNSDTVTVNFTRDTTVETTDLTATNTESQTVEVVVTADEQLTGLEASDGSGNSVSGIGTDGDFEESTDGDIYTYTATYDAGADGDYTVTLDSATDANDNTDTDSGHSDTVTVGTSG